MAAFHRADSRHGRTRALPQNRPPDIRKATAGRNVLRGPSAQGHSPRGGPVRQQTAELPVQLFFSSRPLARPIVKTAKLLVVDVERVQMLFREIVDANNPRLSRNVGAPYRRWVITFRPLDVDVQAVVQMAPLGNPLCCERLAHSLPSFIIGD